ncbi:MAG: response regulator [Deltaproteobacteria bacterium]|nr:response regulator [Deltaproteobacteria bacterium]MBI4794298.1 response regulator [Deltaproteobacteria bacterium]
MNAPGRILIADRNRHVREFLRRELMIEGYQVEVARDGREVLEMIHGRTPPDLLILDLELPYVTELKVLELLQEKLPSLPVIIHSFLPESESHLPETAKFLEKREDTDLLKEVVAELLGKSNLTVSTAAPDRGG